MSRDVNYERWQNDPGANPWHKSGYNPRSNYGMMKLVPAGPPLDVWGWLLISPFWMFGGWVVWKILFFFAGALL